MIEIIAVGKIKENYLVQGCNDYLKRIKRFDDIRIVELREGLGESEKMKSMEGDSFINALHDDIENIVCDISGEMITSEDFAVFFQKLYTTGGGKVSFLIGGSEGFSKKVLDRADRRISFSRFTFPHQLFRLILLEQIYRAQKILNNQKYHK